MSMDNSNGKADAYKMLTSQTGLITPSGFSNPVDDKAVLHGCGSDAHVAINHRLKSRRGRRSHKVPIATSKPYGKRAEHTREALP